MTISGQLFIPAQYATYQAFENDDTVSDNQLSFVEDRRELYLGKALYPGAIEILGSSDSFPEQVAARIGVLYCKPSTMEIRRYTNTSYDVLVRPLDTTVNSGSSNPVTGGAVYSHVQDITSDLQTAVFNKMDKVSGTAGTLPQLDGTGGLTGTSINAVDVVVDSDIQKLIKSITENNGTWTITYVDNTQSTFQTAVTDYLNQVDFDPETGVLTFHFTTSEGEPNTVTVDLSALVDVYTGLSGYYIPDARVTVTSATIGNEIFASGTYMQNTHGIYRALQDNVVASNYSNTGMWAQQSVASTTDAVWTGTNQLYLNGGVYYKVPVNDTGNASAILSDGALYQRPIDVNISGYTVEAMPVLDKNGHLTLSRAGLAVRTGSTIASDTTIPQGKAVINYVSSAAIKKGTWTQAGLAVKTNASGGLDATSYQYGSGALAATPSSNTLATEAAVQSAIDGTAQNLSTQITAINNNKVDKVDGTANKLLLSNGSGGFVVTEKSIGGATISTSPSVNTLATEAAVVAKVNEITSGAITVWK